LLSKPMKTTRLRAKEDIVSAAHAFAVALSEGKGNIASAKVGPSDSSPIHDDLAAKLSPSMPGHSQSVAGRESRAPENGADQAEKRPTISIVSHPSIGLGAPIRRGKWRRSIAATIIAITFLFGGTLLMVKASPVEIVRDAYVRIVAEFQKRTGLENVGLDTTARKAADREGITKGTERNATEANLADEAAARRKKQEEHDAAEQRPTTEAVRKAAEDEARVVAPEMAQRPAAEDTRHMAEPVERKAVAQKSKSDAEIRNEAQRAEAGLNLSEQDRKKVQASLSALGNQVPVTGYFGPVTRTMIAAWQNKQGLPETGFVNDSQLLALHEQAALPRRADQAKPVAQQPEKVEAALNLSEQDRKKVQVALSSLGHPIPTPTGYFGPRTRAMITAWQKAQGLAETGYLTEAQLATLWQQATPALSKYNQIQRKPGQD
jgi:peptidoglycan hydrolase-like protein with peptidoglycan-binding domain